MHPPLTSHPSLVERVAPAFLAPATLFLALAFGSPSPVLAQGSLTPPAGPPAPTMRTLDEISAQVEAAEPRMAINEVNTPGDGDGLFVISQPGSYYLTGNFTGVSGKHGIKVAASGVTIDLKGFTVRGVPGSQNGIYSGLTQPGLTVRGGTIRDWGAAGIQAQFAASSSYSGLALLENGGAGLVAGPSSVISDCRSHGNDGLGFYVFDNSVLTRLTATGCFSGIQAIHSQIDDCSAIGNEHYGIVTTGGSITRCLARSNNSIGIRSSGVMESCTADGNEIGIMTDEGAVVRGCRVVNSQKEGIRVAAPSIVSGNHARGNGSATADGAGILVVGNESTIAENTCSENDRGIVVQGSMNRIDGNQLTGNGIGLHVSGQYNIIVRNAARNTAGTNYNIHATNRGGVYVAPALSGAVNGSSGGAGSGTTDPFANLSF